MSMLPVAHRRARWLLMASLAGAMSLTLAACGSSSNKNVASSPTSAAGSSSTSSSPGAKFSAAKVSGLGTAVVDGRGRTVYVLTADGRTSLPCEDSTGCTKAWPDLSLPDGVHAAAAGSGLTASLLGTKLAQGETYPTYGGWLLYEFSGDSGPAQGHGEGIKSFGGTWYALSPSGTPLMMAAAPSTTASNGTGY
jgi:predicted lipoprotein with Yx(FWY)xxD motif